MRLRLGKPRNLLVGFREAFVVPDLRVERLRSMDATLKYRATSVVSSMWPVRYASVNLKLDRGVWDALPELDVVVSNPPYIPVFEARLMPPHVLEHEPHLALFVPDDADPLLFYRVIAEQARAKLRPGGRIFFECNEFNAKDVVELLQNLRYHHIELKTDLSGADRMVRAVWNAE